jgi:hypothetical protein
MQRGQPGLSTFHAPEPPTLEVQPHLHSSNMAQQSYIIALALLQDYLFYEFSSCYQLGCGDGAVGCLEDVC